MTELWGGDLRPGADGEVAELRRLLREFPGIGPAGADIFLREAQGVWPEVAPCLDARTLAGAERFGLPMDPEQLLSLAGDAHPAVLAAASVRAAIDDEVAEDSLRRTG